MIKVAIVAVMLALVLAVAVPAVAQVTQAPAETFVSGTNTNNAGSVTSSGSNSNTCAVQQGFNNSGGLLNLQQIQQYDSTIGTGLVFTGSTFNNTPAQTVPCAPTVEQAASSSGA